MEHLFSNQKGTLNIAIDTAKFKGQTSGEIAERLLMVNGVECEHYEITKIEKLPNDHRTRFNIMYWDF